MANLRVKHEQIYNFPLQHIEPQVNWSTVIEEKQVPRGSPASLPGQGQQLGRSSCSSHGETGSWKTRGQLHAGSSKQQGRDRGDGTRPEVAPVLAWQGPYFLFYPTLYTLPAREGLKPPNWFSHGRPPAQLISPTRSWSIPTPEPGQAQLRGHLQEEFPGCWQPPPVAPLLTQLLCTPGRAEQQRLWDGPAAGQQPGGGAQHLPQRGHGHRATHRQRRQQGQPSCPSLSLLPCRVSPAPSRG